MTLPRNATQPALASTETQLIAAKDALDVRVTAAEATLTTVSTHEARIASLETEPPAHGSTHLPGGADDIPEVSETAAGWCPQLSGTATEYLDGTGAWSVPAGGGGGVTDHGLLTGLADDDHTQYVLANGTRSNWPVPTTSPTAASVPKSLAGGQLDSNWIRQTVTCDYRAASTISPGQCYIANVSTGVALSTKALAANTEYWIPYVAPKSGANLANVLIQVSTASAGTSVIVGLYLCNSNPSNANWPNFGDFRPVGSPLVQQTQSTAATGTFTLSSVTATLVPGFTYWFCILSSGAPTLRGGGTNQTNCNLGWQIPSGTTVPNAITHWTQTRTFASGLRTGLLGTESYNAGTAAFPAVFLSFA